MIETLPQTDENCKINISIHLDRSTDFSETDSPQLKDVSKLKCTFEDEMLLTETGIDCESIEVYDFSALYSNVSSEHDDLHYKIKAFKKADSFFLILNSTFQTSNFTSLLLTNILKFVKTLRIKDLIICLKKDISKKELSRMNKSLRFIGFKKLSKDSLRRITVSELFSFFKYEIEN